MQTLSPGLRKLSGVEPTSKISYTRIFLDGALVPPNSPPDAAPLKTDTPPVLIAECTQESNGKLRFELHYPPWHPTPGDLYPPDTRKSPSLWTSSDTRR